MSALVKVVIQPAPVYCLPWSVFIISGLPYRAIATSRASTQKLASNILESRQVKNLTGRPIIDCHQIYKAVLDGDVGDVAALNLIGPRDCELSQQVWIDPGVRILFADIWSLVPSHACKHALPSSEWSVIQ